MKRDEDLGKGEVKNPTRIVLTSEAKFPIPLIFEGGKEGGYRITLTQPKGKRKGVMLQ